MYKLITNILIPTKSYFISPGHQGGAVPEEDPDSTKNIQNQYSYGDCGVFAVAMQESYGYPLVGFFKDEELYHVAVEVEDDVYMDVQGVQTSMSIYTRYNSDFPSETPIPKDMTRREVHFYGPFEESDLTEAKRRLDLLIERNIMPSYTPDNIKMSEVNSAGFESMYPVAQHTLVPNGERFDPEWLDGADMYAVMPESDEQARALFKDMSQWMRSPVARAEADSTDNAVAVILYLIQNKPVLVSFDMGGSDNCEYRLSELTKNTLPSCQKTHAHLEDLLNFVDMHVNTSNNPDFKM